MKKILIDVGANLGQGLEAMMTRYSIDDTWEVYSFEPNKYTFNKVQEKYKHLHHIKFYNKGVWDSNCKRLITYEFCPNENDHVGGASNLLEENFVKPNYIDDSYIDYSKDYVECIDLSSFIKSNFNIWDFIVLKLDCEGAEYPILEKMIRDNTLTFINEMFVEWHNKMLKNKYDEESIKSSIYDAGIILHAWY